MYNKIIAALTACTFSTFTFAVTAPVSSGVSAAQTQTTSEDSMAVATAPPAINYATLIACAEVAEVSAENKEEAVTIMAACIEANSKELLDATKAGTQEQVKSAKSDAFKWALKTTMNAIKASAPVISKYTAKAKAAFFAFLDSLEVKILNTAVTLNEALKMVVDGLRSYGWVCSSNTNPFSCR